MRHEITAEISTKDRYDLLAHSLSSIINQTYKPYEVMIFDDGACLDLREHHIFANLFRIMDRKGIKWRFVFGEKKGQVANHIKALKIATTDWVWRVDDDNIVEPDCLERLVPLMDDPKVGAVAGCVLHPDTSFSTAATSPSIKDVFFRYAIQFAQFQGVRECEHLYSTFITRRINSSDCYPADLSPVGHREETTMSYNLHKKGYKLLVNGEAVTWHLRAGYGGIRTFNDKALWDHDEYRFHERLKKWNVTPNECLFVYLNHGIGDNYMFKSILPEIRRKHPDKKLVISTCYPQVFEDSADVEVVDLDTGKHLCRGNTEAHNVYKFAFDNNWKTSFVDAFRAMYSI